MQIFKTLNDNPEKFRKDLDAATAEMIAEIQARKAEEAAGERPVPVNRTWRYANSNFGMGL